MRIDKLEARALTIPFKSIFRHAAAERATTQALWVSASGDGFAQTDQLRGEKNDTPLIARTQKRKDPSGGTTGRVEPYGRLGWMGARA